MDSRVNGHEVIQFARDASKSSDQLDTAGQTILQLIQRAAGVAEDNSRQALEMAQKLSHQLQSAEARVAELEADVDGYREKCDRAEQWLHRIYTEIEERFLRQGEGLRGAPQRRRA
jgi:DNA repair exonuclease SbcCD ATPase subunit